MDTKVTLPGIESFGVFPLEIAFSPSKDPGPSKVLVQEGAREIISQGTKIYTCEISGCNFSRFDRQEILNHYVVHKRQVSFVYQCPVCGKKYESPPTARSHSRVEHGHSIFFNPHMYIYRSYQGSRRVSVKVGRPLGDQPVLSLETLRKFL